MRISPGADHRHTLEHVQMADRAQFRRMRNLGICVNLFANHLYYFGDVHWTRTLGPDRAGRMDACADALEIFGGEFAIHSDAPVTPMAPLFTAWCAVNRLTEEVEVGKLYLGKVRKIMEFGAFVEVLPGTDGLVHISQLAHHRVKSVSDEVAEGDQIMVKVLEIDKQGKIRLSRKDAMEPTSKSPAKEPAAG